MERDQRKDNHKGGNYGVDYSYTFLSRVCVNNKYANR